MKKSEPNQNNHRTTPFNEGRYEIRFSGSGGQGIITAAIIFAEAVTAHGKHHVCQTQSYGPEARGGTSKADVVMSPEPVDYPKAVHLDVLLAMNQASSDTYFRDLKPHGLLIADAGLVTHTPIQRALFLPFTEMARRVTGKKLSANLVALGALAMIGEDMLPVEQLKQAIRNRVPPGTREMNLEAFDAGLEAARNVELDTLPETISDEEDEP